MGGDKQNLWRVRENESNSREREGRRFHQYGGQQALIRQLSLSSCTGVGRLSRGHCHVSAFYLHPAAVGSTKLVQHQSVGIHCCLPAGRSRVRFPSHLSLSLLSSVVNPVFTLGQLGKAPATPTGRWLKTERWKLLASNNVWVPRCKHPPEHIYCVF